MPRTARRAPGGIVFHVLNRAVARRTLFQKEEDFAAFERVLESVMREAPTRLLAYCLMPTHWHLLLWPRADGELARFMQRLTITHVTRWQGHYSTVGDGHVYQGRFKSFPVQEDGHFLTVARYVERNALRARLVRRAENWRWCSLWRRERGTAEQRGLLSEWPVARPADWLEFVNQPQTDAEVEALRTAVRRGRPFGSERWQEQITKRLCLECSYRPAHRPKTSGTAAHSRA